MRVSIFAIRSLLGSGTLAVLLALPAAHGADLATLGSQEMDQLFAAFDVDESGGVSRDEMRHVVRSVRVGLSDEAIDAMHGSYDSNEDGLLDTLEFAAFMRGFNDGDEASAADLERAFLRFDTNRDSGLDASEIKALMDASGREMSLRDAKSIVFEADDNGNGRIDVDEFAKLAP